MTLLLRDRDGAIMGSLSGTALTDRPNFKITREGTPYDVAQTDGATLEVLYLLGHGPFLRIGDHFRLNTFQVYES